MTLYERGDSKVAFHAEGEFRIGLGKVEFGIRSSSTTPIPEGTFISEDADVFLSESGDPFVTEATP